MIGSVGSSSGSAEADLPESPDPEPGQKWEFRSGPFVAEQIVIEDVGDGHVDFRTMSGNDPGTMATSLLVESGEYVETVDLRDDW